MKKSEIKKIIKPLIRECLTEIFAEMHLETIVEGVVSKKVPAVVESQPKSNNSKVVTEARSPQPSREELLKRYGLEDQAGFYEGTEPLSDDDKPEYVSERDLINSGLVRQDYSKFF